jgi:hypothetical protein
MNSYNYYSFFIGSFSEQNYNLFLDLSPIFAVVKFKHGLMISAMMMNIQLFQNTNGTTFLASFVTFVTSNKRTTYRDKNRKVFVSCVIKWLIKKSSETTRTINSKTCLISNEIERIHFLWMYCLDLAIYHTL